MKNDLNELHVHIKLDNLEKGKSATIVNRLDSIYELMNTRPNAKIAMPNLHSLLKLMKTVAVSSATAERNFSALKRLKLWTRATMSQNSLNNRLFAIIHKTLMDSTNFKDIADEFVNRSQTRKNYFGHEI